MMSASGDPAGHREHRGLRPVSPIDTGQIRVSEAKTVADFARCLEEVRILAGPLSHRELQSRSGGRLGRTKIGKVLKGMLPQRDFLLVFLEVCGVSQDNRHCWLEVWGRLTRVDNGHATMPGPAEDDQATDIVANAQARAEKIIEEGRAAVAALLTRAKAEAEQLTRSANARVLRAEDDREAAIAQARSANRELEATLERHVQRIRFTEDERDRALNRAHTLSNTLTELQDTTRTQIAEAEEQRNSAWAKVNKLTAELEIERQRVKELSERNERLRAQTGHDERYAPAYLAEPDPDGVFGTDEMTAPPVIGH